MTRKTKLEKALAGPKNPLRGEGYSSTTRNWMAGESDTYAVLAPLHAALIEAVAALEAIQWSWDNDAGRQCSNITEEALAKIDKALDQQTKNSNS